MTPLESELMKFVEKWTVALAMLNRIDQHAAVLVSDMLTELELILSIEKEKR